MAPVAFRLPVIGLPIYCYGIFAVSAILIGRVVGALEADGITDLSQQLPGTSPVPRLFYV
jgi:hypothetical protein